MKRLFALSITLLPFSAMIAQQAPGIEWQNTIGGNDWDKLFCVQQTTDGGFILGGSSMSEQSGDKEEGQLVWDYWIIKTDATGSIQWQNTIGGTNDDYLNSIHQTADGGYILSGNSASGMDGDKTEVNYGSHDYWIVKTDATGNIEWQNTIGGSGEDWLYSIDPTSDGGYILGGRSNSNTSGDKTEASMGSNDYWIVKTDDEGTIEWENTIGGTLNDELYSIQQTADGGYILGGHSNSNISGDKTENSNGNFDYWIVKTDASGNIEWQNTIGGSNYDLIFNAARQTSDGGYIVGGHSSSAMSGDKTENSIGSYDYWIVKLDGSGNIQWQNTIGGSNSDYLYSITGTYEGGYILGGYSDSGNTGDKTQNSKGSFDYWIVKTDASGNITWQKTIGGGNNDYLYYLQQTGDGGFILAGESESNDSGDKTEDSQGNFDYWLVKVSPETGIENTASDESFHFFPNPASSHLTITPGSGIAEGQFEISDVLGRVMVSAKYVLSPTSTMQLDVSMLPAGIYTLTLLSDGATQSMTFMKE